MAATGKTPILLYGSTTATNAPVAGNLTNSSDGCEIAINVADKNLFFKDSTNTVNTVPIRQSSASSNGWLSSTDWSTFNGKAPAFTYTTGYIPFGQGTTTPTQSANLFFDGNNLLVGTTSSDMASGYGFKLATAAGGTNNPRLGIVVSDSTSSTQPLSIFSVGAGNWRFYVDAAGTIHATNSTISSISDERLKENIRDLDAGIASIMALKPRRFDWKTGQGKDIKDDCGFIAQEFEQVFPDLIDEWKCPSENGEIYYKSIRQDLIPVLVKSIQEQQKQITQLENRIAQLEGK